VALDRLRSTAVLAAPPTARRLADHLANVAGEAKSAYIRSVAGKFFASVAPPKLICAEATDSPAVRPDSPNP